MRNRFLALLLLVVFGCKDNGVTSYGPDWLNKKIQQFESGPLEASPGRIYSYEYTGNLVYYILSPCCDQFNFLYNDQGLIICAPDGGFTGAGDGKCVDFRTERKNEKIVWQDKRIYKQ